MKNLLLDIVNRSDKEYFDLRYFIKKLNIKTSKEQKELIKNLNSLIDDGSLYEYFERNKILYIKKSSLLEGRLEIKEKGYGFVITEKEDIFIANKNLNNAFHDDIVLVYPTLSTGNNKEGVIIKIVDRKIINLVGTIRKKKNKFYFDNDNPKHNFDVIINDSNLVDNEKVILKITKYHVDYVYASIVKRLGQKEDLGIDILSLVYEFGIDPDFPKEVLDYVGYINFNEDEIKNRLDLRSLNIVTIDGIDAKDLDDAISIEKLNNGNYKLGVHIADVSYYVKNNSVLDLEAYKRGTSIYLLDRVIPMLPEKLSNDLCSLNPHTDKLAISCFMTINEKGQVLATEVFESVINSKYRLNYDEVNEIVNNGLIKYEDILDDLYLMKELKIILSNKRDKRGSLDFLTLETKFILENNKIKEIKPKKRIESEAIIEEFMLLCNESIATLFYNLELPVINRIHEEPNQIKLDRVLKIIKNLGYNINTKYNELTPYVVNKVLKELENSKNELFLNNMLLRSMSKARYHPSHLGHFGLALKHYLHFTSPIRRYPDLVVHRLLREFIFNKKINKKNLSIWESKLNEISNNTSLAERKAIDLERAVEDMKKAEYMMDFIGYEFNGVVSGITNFGVFVMLENSCEGLIRFDDLGDDYYEYNEDLMILVGKNTGKIIKYNDEVIIEVINASKIRRIIDFKLIKFLG